MLCHECFFPLFLLHGSRIKANKPKKRKIIENKITPKDVEETNAVPIIATKKDVKTTIPDTRALSSTAVLSDMYAVTSGKHSPNDIPTNALESKEMVVP